MFIYTVDWKKQSASVDMVITRCRYRNMNIYIICIALLISSVATITGSSYFVHQQQYVSCGMRETCCWVDVFV